GLSKSIADVVAPGESQECLRFRFGSWCRAYFDGLWIGENAQLTIQRRTREWFRCDRLDNGRASLGGNVKIYFRQSRMVLNEARENHEQPLAEDHGDAVKSAANADEKRLLLLGGGKQVKAVNGNVLCRRTEGQQPEERECVLKKVRGGNGERHAGETAADDQLRDPNPLPPRLQNVHDGTPERLDHPRQVKPACVKSDVRVRNPKALVQNDRHRHHHHV